MANVNECGIAAKQSSTCTQKCRTCQREGIPILPLRYAVIPKDKATGRGLLGTATKGGGGILSAPDLGKNYKKFVLKEHVYSVRSLRMGFVYVYLEATKVWQAYGVKPDGSLSQFVDHLRPPADIQAEMKAECFTANDNVPAAFINIPDIGKTPIVWIAFSSFAWDSAIFDQYAGDATLRARRMSEVNLPELKKQPTQGDSFEIDQGLNTLSTWVEDYGISYDLVKRRAEWKVPELDKIDTTSDFGKQIKAALTDKKSPATWSVHPFGVQNKSIATLAAFVKRNKATYKMPVIAVVLDDVPGILQELNYSKVRASTEKNVWSLVDDRAHKIMSSNSTHGLEAYIKMQAKAKTRLKMAANGGKNLKFTDETASKLMYDGLEMTHAEYQTKLDTGELPTSARWVKTHSITGSADIGRIVDETQAAADSDHARQYKQFYNKLDKERLKEFDNFYIKYNQESNAKTDRLGSDMNRWLHHDEDPKHPKKPVGLTTLTKIDFIERKRFDERYVEFVADVFRGFQADKHTLTWIEKTLKHPPQAPEQILVRALVGNHTDAIDAFFGDNYSKIYDVAKQIATAKLTKAENSKNALHALTSFLMGIGGQLSNQLAKLNWDTINQAMTISQKTVNGTFFERVTITGMSAAEVQEVLELQAQIEKTYAKNGAAPSANQSKIRRKLQAKLPKNIKISFEMWVAGETKTSQSGAVAASLETAAADVKTFAGVTILHNGKTYKLNGSTAKAWYASSIKNSAKLALGRDAGLAIGSLYFQWAGLQSALKSYNDATLDQKTSSGLGLASAAFGLFGGMVEGAKIVASAAEMSAKTGGKTASRLATTAEWAGRISGGAGIVAGAIDTFGGGRQAIVNYQEGDFDATTYYALGTTAAFTGTVVSAYYIVWLGSTAFLGPVGWVILLGVATAGFFWYAGECEDTAPAIWMAQNKFWSTDKDRPHFRNWKEEEDALNGIFYGLYASVELDGNNFIYGGPTSIPVSQPDCIRFEVNVARFDSSEQSWRYRVLGVQRQGGQKVVLDQMCAPNTQAFLTPIPLADAKAIQLRRGPSSVSMPNGGLKLQRNIEVDINSLKEVQLEFEFLRDSTDPESVTLIKLSAQQNTTAQNY